MVIYSMATSTLGDPLHGMKFVCSLNRLKVVMFRGALGLRFWRDASSFSCPNAGRRDRYG